MTTGFFFPVFLGNMGIWEWVIVLVVVLLIFGGRKLPELMHGIGKGISNFRKEVKGKDEDHKA
ncbi:MAG: twin-arginine translocase TatA/TatE family subunit [Muribaculaceae bacterium]|nr:twin-arginine translocase TatA/TatE family subunit [Muribaculaceae bacterium]